MLSATLCSEAFASPTLIRTQTGQEELYSDSYALIVSESAYIHWNTLDSVPGETDKLVTALQQLGFEKTKIAVHKNVPAAELIGLFQAFINEQNHRIPTVRLFIYYAGHGATDQTQQGWLVPVDAPEQSSPEFLYKALAISAVKAVLERAKARHTMMVFDSCFSGSVFESRGGEAPVPNLRLESILRQGVLVITAGNANQKVPAESEFLDVFIRGTSGAADAFGDGYITGVGLSEYLKSHVFKTSPHDGVIAGDSSGQIIFVPGATGVIPYIRSGVAAPLGTEIGSSRSDGAARFDGLGNSFNYVSGNWYLGPPGAIGPVGVRLKEQVSGDQAFLLWDSDKDRLFEVPKTGGVVRVKQGNSVIWSDLGYVEKK